MSAYDPITPILRKRVELDGWEKAYRELYEKFDRVEDALSYAIGRSTKLLNILHYYLLEGGQDSHVAKVAIDECYRDNETER